MPGREILIAIATFFDVSLDWLTSGEGERRPARESSEREALLLQAFRRLTKDERDAHLEFMVRLAQAAERRRG